MKSTKKSVLLILVLAGFFANKVTAQTLEAASPESQGMSSSVLSAATAQLQQHIDDGDIAGVVAAVARNGKLVYFESLGYLNLENKTPMPKDALFRTYSMTRQITSAATLIAAEQGLVDVNDPVKKYLPQFENQQVLVDVDSADISQVRQRRGDITLANLLTHTSGLGSRSSQMYRQNNVRDRSISLDDMVGNAARIPLFEDPGTNFRYGISATILGKVIEVASGQPFDDYLQENLFQPLVMQDTVFWADATRSNRLAGLYRPTDGKLLPHQIESVPFTTNPKLREGGVGLLSSVMDYMRFGQMVLNRGEINGRQIFGDDTADLIFQNWIPDSVLPLSTRGYFAGSGWTLGGFNIVMDNSHYNFPVSNGTIWWDGSAGTRYFVDPNENMVIVIMAQVSPSSGNGFRENFKKLVDDAIIDRRD